MTHDALLPGSALCQSMVTGSRLSTPVSGRVRRPSDVGLRSSSGLPSPQVSARSLLCPWSVRPLIVIVFRF